MADQSARKLVSPAREAIRRVLRAMAYDWIHFKDKISEYCRGAAREFYKARLAEKNDYPEHVQGWHKEADALMLSAKGVVGWQITGFKDRRKAAHEALAEVRRKDKNLQTQATNHIKTYYKVTRLNNELNAEDTDALTQKLRSAIDDALAGVGAE